VRKPKKGKSSKEVDGRASPTVTKKKKGLKKIKL